MANKGTNEDIESLKEALNSITQHCKYVQEHKEYFGNEADSSKANEVSTITRKSAEYLCKKVGKFDFPSVDDLEQVKERRKKQRIFLSLLTVVSMTPLSTYFLTAMVNSNPTGSVILSNLFMGFGIGLVSGALVGVIDYFVSKRIIAKNYKKSKENNFRNRTRYRKVLDYINDNILFILDGSIEFGDIKRFSLLPFLGDQIVFSNKKLSVSSKAGEYICSELQCLKDCVDTVNFNGPIVNELSLGLRKAIYTCRDKQAVIEHIQGSDLIACADNASLYDPLSDNDIKPKESKFVKKKR